jgi:L-rhamnose isomerase
LDRETEKEEIHTYFLKKIKTESSRNLWLPDGILEVGI